MNFVKNSDIHLISQIISPIWSKICEKIPRDRIHKHSMLQLCQKEFFIDTINERNIISESLKFGDSSMESCSIILMLGLVKFEYHVIPFLLTLYRIDFLIYNEIKLSGIFSTKDHQIVETYNNRMNKHIKIFLTDTIMIEYWDMFARFLCIHPKSIIDSVYYLISKKQKTLFLLDFCNKYNQNITLLDILKILENQGLMKTVEYIHHNYDKIPVQETLDEYVLVDLLKPYIDDIIQQLNIFSKIHNFYISRMKLTNKFVLGMVMRFFKNIEYVGTYEMIDVLNKINAEHLIPQIKDI